MSLSHVEWRYVGSLSFATASVASVLDSLYTLGTTGSYADGTSRVENSGSAWNFTGNTFLSSSTREAVWCTPPGTNTQTVLIAGSAVNQPNTGSMASPDTSAQNIMFVNMTRGSGSYSNWTANPPITGGSASFGYWRAWPTSAGIGVVYLWESKECIATIVSTTVGTTYGFIAGAILDPETTGASEAEADGRLYGLITAGTLTAINTGMNGGASNVFIGAHNTSANGNHGGVFSPGSSTIIQLNTQTTLRDSSTGNLKNSGGKFIRLPILMGKNSATPNNNFMGRLRDIVYCSDGKTGQKLTDGATVIGYLLGSHTTVDNDQVMLEHG